MGKESGSSPALPISLDGPNPYAAKATTTTTAGGAASGVEGECCEMRVVRLLIIYWVLKDRIFMTLDDTE